MITELNIENLKTPLPSFNYGKCWVAGGAIRDSLLGESYSDIDIFGANLDLTSFITDNLKSYKQIFDSELIKTFIQDDIKVQVIFRDYKTLQDCLDSFDYTICMFAFDGTKIYAESNALIHLFNKRLVINKLNSDYVVNSLERLQKYIQKGYSICNDEIKQLVDTLRNAEQPQINNQFEFYSGSKTPRIRAFD